MVAPVVACLLNGLNLLDGAPAATLYFSQQTKGMSWKREEIPDHKFDYVDIEEFTDNSFWRKFAYSSVFIFALKGNVKWTF